MPTARLASERFYRPVGYPPAMTARRAWRFLREEGPIALAREAARYVRRETIPAIAFRLARARGRDRVTYDLGGREVTIRFVNAYERDYFTDAFTETGHVRREDVHWGLFELDPAYDAALDVGAHVGFYTLLLGKLNPDLPVYAFEPGAYNTRVLERTLAANGVEAEVVTGVVTDHDGTVAFHERDRIDSGLTTATMFDWQTEATLTEKPAIRLSSFCADRGLDTVFVKIDAEGEEVGILRDLTGPGGPARVSGHVEVHDYKLEGLTREDVVALLEERGYDYRCVAETDQEAQYLFSNHESLASLWSPRQDAAGAGGGRPASAG